MTILAAVYNLALILFIALHLAVGGAVRDTNQIGPFSPRALSLSIFLEHPNNKSFKKAVNIFITPPLSTHKINHRNRLICFVSVDVWCWNLRRNLPQPKLPGM